MMLQCVKRQFLMQSNKRPAHKGTSSITFVKRGESPVHASCREGRPQMFIARLAVNDRKRRRHDPKAVG